MSEYHFIAIGGIGMSALAHILLERGDKVYGSDQKNSAITDSLKLAGAKIFIGYDPANLPSLNVPIVYSTAVERNNPELEAAKAKGFVLLHRAELLKQLMKHHKGLLVAGTHGKTTTSSLLSHTLLCSGKAPCYAVGGIMTNYGKNGGQGQGEYFVAEACESDGTFLHYPGYGAIVTNIDTDHLDYWKDNRALCLGFAKFFENISSKSHLLYCSDDDRIRSLKPEGISYGFEKGAQARILSFDQEGWKQRYKLEICDRLYEEIEIPLIGRHNVLNSAAVFVLGLQLGLSESDLRKAFVSFKGVRRRVEKKGEYAGVELYDDYGHHPTEIATTLAGIKAAIGNKRLIAIFQPHRFTRTRDCLEEFALAFEKADFIVFTDIYSAGEKPIEGINTELVIQKMKEKYEEKFAYFSRNTLKNGVLSLLCEKDVVITMGAGDITYLSSELC